MRKSNAAIKRGFDFLSSIIAAIIVCPLLAIIAVSIKVSSKGPVIFKQKRLGQNGSTFEIYKFRTMVPNAENMGTGVTVSEKTDDRITGIGRILRATSLDELPQLFNIIKGDMSLVGPRPPVTYHPYDGFANYPEWARTRFDMKPGLTGLAQVRLSVDASWDERMKTDVEYVRNYSPFLDLKILGLTAGAVLHRGSY